MFHCIAKMLLFHATLLSGLGILNTECTLWFHFAGVRLRAPLAYVASTLFRCSSKHSLPATDDCNVYTVTAQHLQFCRIGMCSTCNMHKL